MDAISLTLLLCHAAATLFMVGLIWFVQRVHYPLLSGVGMREFATYEQAHVGRTFPVVGPPMVLEAVTGAALVAVDLPGVPTAIPWIGVALLALVWLATAMLLVPRHRELSAGFDARSHRQLVAFNWIRTLAWSLRGALVLWMLASILDGRS